MHVLKSFAIVLRVIYMYMFEYKGIIISKIAEHVTRTHFYEKTISGTNLHACRANIITIQEHVCALPILLGYSNLVTCLCVY